MFNRPASDAAPPGAEALAPAAARLAGGRHVLIAGPTASGKSALALELACREGGLIVNADALQVWSCWRVLTARPSPADENRAPHRLYGHMAPGAPWSVGTWLGQVGALVAQGQRLIVTGGTGLYLDALTRGLAPIPPVPPEIAARAAAMLAAPDGLGAMVAGLDPATRARIDTRNPVRVRRAWEVLAATGRGLADWQATTGPALIPPADCARIVLAAPRDWLAQRIEARFDAMIAEGALDEVRAMLPRWDPAALWARAIGAPELVAHLRGEATLAEVRDRAVTATRQYAKAQRIFFRNRLADWSVLQTGE